MRLPLEKSLRSALERTTLAAREAAESAARDVLEHLGVTLAKAPDWLDADQAALRRALRARARALGGELAADGTQKVAALVEEIAYEQWNRMVFARFLAENGLLMYDGVAVTLDDCAALAEELGLGSAWDVAADSAAKMLPNVFRTDSLSFRIAFAPDKVNRLKELVEGLDPATFQASDALGWIYQYWQTKKKASVNASEVKIGADELAPVTQLFTEPYMVAFLLDNTLGAWYAAPKLKGRTFATEAEARAAVATPELPLAYLRLVPSGDRTSVTPGTSGTDGRAVAPRPPCEWRPAAGSFDKWPASLADFSMLDPCCGSGHFAVAALLMLVPMRMEIEGLDARTAVERVLVENIHALELDRRCVEIAVFAVALEAWRYPNAGGYRKLPKLHIACDGIAPNESRDEWIRLARRAARKMTNDDDKLIVDINDATLFEAQLVRSMGELWDCFQQAPILGSLISPDLFASDLFHADYATLADVLADHFDKSTAEEREAALAAQGIIEAIQLLGRKYTLVATNVPYLLRRKQSEALQRFCQENYPDSKGDLATVFLERCLRFCIVERASRPFAPDGTASRPFAPDGTGETPVPQGASQVGTTAFVLPQNWLFLGTYRKFREKLLKKFSLGFLARLGAGGFQTPMWDFNIQLFILHGEYSSSEHCLFGEDVSQYKEAALKAKGLPEAAISSVNQSRQLENPDSKILLDDLSNVSLLENSAIALNGMHGGDSLHYRFAFWEVDDFTKWNFFQGTVPTMSLYSGRTNVFWWPDNGRCHRENPAAFVKGEAYWGRPGIVVSMMGKLPATLYTGEKFDISCSPIILNDDSQLAALWCYCSSPEYHENVRRIDQKLNVTNATLAKVPFDLTRWQKVAEEQYPHGLPKPFTDDPTQWIFHGHPCGSVVWDETAKRLKIGPDRMDATVLHVAVARLMGYKWPSELEGDGVSGERCAGGTGVPPVLGEENGQDARSTEGAENGQDARSTKDICSIVRIYGAAQRDVSSHYFSRMAETSVHERNLPHWGQHSALVFITFRLADSLPQEVLRKWQSEKEEWLRTHPEPWTADVVAEFEEMFPARFEKWLDQGEGACILNDERCRQIVFSALEFFDAGENGRDARSTETGENGRDARSTEIGGTGVSPVQKSSRYRLHAAAVAANHVHVLMELFEANSLPQILHSWKSFTAKEINKALGTTGVVWQSEYHDRLIRNARHYENTLAYVRRHDGENGGTGVSPVRGEESGRDARSTDGNENGRDARSTDAMELADEMRAVMARNAALEKFVDDDGIVCIPALNGEEGAAARVAAMLETAYGAAWSAQTLEKLLAAVGAEGKTLEEWLRKDFFLQHAKLFGNRPFIWQIWDGLRDGFSVLVNYHKLDRKGLETLIYSYLGDWITRQNQDVAQGVPGAGEKLDRAQELKGKLEKILEGEAPYDIFVRWKSLAEQPVGWNPDLNDGVRLNIRPFCEAGVLREKAQKLNLKWAKDRGKDVASAPWYAVFKGDRINDHHTTLAEKTAARKSVS